MWPCEPVAVVLWLLVVAESIALIGAGLAWVTRPPDTTQGD